MLENTQRSRLLNILHGKKVDRVPVASVTQTGTVSLMKATGAYWPKAHREATTMADLGLAGHYYLGLECVRIPFSLTSEVASMGCEIDYHETRNDFAPSVKKGLKLEELRLIEPTSSIMGEVIKAVSIIRKKIGEDVPIIVGVTGPFTIAGFIRDFSQIMRDLFTNPGMVNTIEERILDIIVGYSNHLLDAGADVIALIEPNASTIGPVNFRNYVLPHLRKIVGKIKAPTVLHICGNTIPIMNLMAETGVEGISIDQKVIVHVAKDLIKSKARLFGNIDPVGVLLEKKPEEIEIECKRVIADGIDVLAPGCGLSPYTPTENVKAMVKAAINTNVITKS